MNAVETKYTPDEGPGPPSSRRAVRTASIDAALRVLVVDDDRNSRESIEELVIRHGHECVTACDGVEAWAIHSARPADLILADWRMPRMDGIELCRLVRAPVRGAYTYFVFMTGLDDRRHLLDGLRAGADDYLTKPLDLEELETRLLAAARVIGMQRAHVERNRLLLGETKEALRAARIDDLTQIANRLRLREDLGALESRAARYGHRYSAAFADVDLFKSYNDAYGHGAGDDVLRRVATSMSKALRKGDTIYRYGGEEFLVILPEQSAAEATYVMDRVRLDVEALGLPHAGTGPGVVTISVGVAELGPSGGTCDEWIKRADSALYTAKREGRNRVESEPPEGIPS